eukprot:TRINITY_DN8376_c0_g1_i2.p1 TRINITY_DN8376_c0_g1~~TRINITY_DN8376_c0_g1_i2.p1  ORF type:complete len:287 (-),score=51.80 TRINITY_DN8376_c0_g1_i2:1657-2517(-)
MVIFAIVCTILVQQLTQVRGWGHTGHAAVAAVASELLSSTSTSALKSILHGKTIQDYASWADEGEAKSKYPGSSKLHFVDMQSSKFDCEYVRERDCPDNWCLAGAIDNYTSLIKSGGAQDLSDGVKFLVHFIGDLANPLHVGFASDRGGTQLKGTFLGRSAKNLHSVWDGVMIEERISNDFGRNSTLFFEQLISRVSVGGDLYSELTSFTSCTENCVDKWASESAAYNCDHVYKDDNDEWVSDHFELGNAYYERSIALIERVLVVAGVRLAQILNDAFDRANALVH